ncbi:MAG: glycosyltransferase, partial [Saprospiraceae bacterium]|nr:glycosyltransferase [Saprospiraceae bacterium]
IELTRNYGFAKGNNLGTHDVSSKYIAFLNSDVHVIENWLDPIIKFLEENQEYGVAMPKVVSFENEKYFEYAGASGGYTDIFGYPFCRGRIFDSIEEDKGQYDSVESISWASGAAFVIRRDLYEKSGGFDEDFFAHHEEIDLCWLLRNAGHKIAVIPSSKILHLGGGTLDYEDTRKIHLNFRNNLFSIFKNEHWFRLIFVLPGRLLLDGVAGLKFLLEGKFTSILAVLKAHLLFYISIPRLIVKRFKNRKFVKTWKRGPVIRDGIMNSSIVFKYFIAGKKTFRDLK